MLLLDSFVVCCPGYVHTYVRLYIFRFLFHNDLMQADRNAQSMHDEPRLHLIFDATRYCLLHEST